VFRPGEIVKILPSMIESRIKNIYNAGMKLKECSEGESVSIELEDQIDIGRGDMLTAGSVIPKSARNIEVLTCWFNNRPLVAGGKYILRLNNQEVRCITKSVRYKININNLEQDLSDATVNMNDIAHVCLTCSKPVFFDSYKVNNITGSLIFIDEGTNETAGAGMVI
jgi:sulfate adenylyltransferase subunit 1